MSELLTLSLVLLQVDALVIERSDIHVGGFVSLLNFLVVFNGFVLLLPIFILVLVKNHLLLSVIGIDLIVLSILLVVVHACALQRISILSLTRELLLFFLNHLLVLIGLLVVWLLALSEVVSLVVVLLGVALHYFKFKFSKFCYSFQSQSYSS